MVVVNLEFDVRREDCISAGGRMFRSEMEVLIGRGDEVVDFVGE